MFRGLFCKSNLTFKQVRKAFFSSLTFRVSPSLIPASTILSPCTGSIKSSPAFIMSLGNRMSLAIILPTPVGMPALTGLSYKGTGVSHNSTFHPFANIPAIICLISSSFIVLFFKYLYATGATLPILRMIGGCPCATSPCILRQMIILWTTLQSPQPSRSGPYSQRD